RPAIDYLFEWLGRSGIRRAVLALGRDNDDLAEAYPRGRRGDLEIVVVREKERLESGGAIRNAVKAAGIEGRFAVLNGDVFVDFDFEAAVEAHDQAKAELTLALYHVDDPSSFGVAVLDERNMVKGFVEKPPPGTAPSHLVNAGVWIFEHHLVGEIPPGAVRVEETLFPSLVARGRPVLGYTFTGLWADIGTPARYLALNEALMGYVGNLVVSSSARITDSAEVYLSSIGADCVIGSEALVEGSVLWEGVRVGAGARVIHSVVADGVEIGEAALLENVVVGSGATIPEGVRVPPGTSIDANARYDARDER
ncbi:MAG: sugar phosphate nucleotidyltransferase, partial [Hyphomicrobiales bacterium]